MGVAKGPGLSRGFSEGFWKFREGSGNSGKVLEIQRRLLEIQERFWKFRKGSGKGSGNSGNWIYRNIPLSFQTELQPNPVSGKLWFHVSAGLQLMRCIFPPTVISRLYLSFT